MNQFKRTYFLPLLCILLVFCSCSQSKLVSLFAKTVDIEFKKPQNYSSLTDYQKDALYLIELIKQSYPRLESKVANYKKTSSNFYNAIGRIETEFEFQIEVKKFLACLNDAHSAIGINFREETDFNVRFFSEKSSLIISNIDRTYDSLLIGSTVLSINEQPMSNIMTLVKNFESGENHFWKTRYAFYHLRKPKYLEVLGVLEPGEDMRLSLEKDGIVGHITLPNEEPKKKYKVKKSNKLYSFTKKQNDGFYHQVSKKQDFAYLQMNTCLDYQAVKCEIDNYTNPLTKPIALSFMKNRQKNAMNFGLVLKDLFKQIEQDSISNFILDLRYNAGGDERLGKQLLWYLDIKHKIKGYTNYDHISTYYKESMPKDFKIMNDLYVAKYGTDIPNGELNSTLEFYNEPYFYEIEKEESCFVLDSTISKFKGNIFVLIGRRTNSAAMVLATTMYDNGIGTFVGTPTGNQPSCQTGSSLVKLPNTNEMLQLSICYFERPNSLKNDELALYPHVEVYQTFKDLYVEGVDLQMEYILNNISSNYETEMSGN